MRKEVQLFLAFMREAQHQKILLYPEIIFLLRRVLEITDQERDEVGEILIADFREKHVNSPDFAELNAILQALPESEGGTK